MEVSQGDDLDPSLLVSVKDPRRNTRKGDRKKREQESRHPRRQINSQSAEKPHEHPHPPFPGIAGRQKNKRRKRQHYRATELPESGGSSVRLMENTRKELTEAESASLPRPCPPGGPQGHKHLLAPEKGGRQALGRQDRLPRSNCGRKAKFPRKAPPAKIRIL